MDRTVEPSATAQQAAPRPSDDDCAAKFSKWNTALDSHWGDWKREAREHYDLYAGRQWEKAEEDQLKDANRQPVTIDRVTTVIDAVSGAEIMGRQAAAYFPRTVGDSAANEILTRGAEWVRDQADADFEESEAIRDAFICGMGWTETRMDYEEDPEGRILVTRTDPLEMAVDPSHKKPGCLDARYLRRRKPISEEDFERLFPGKTATGDPDDVRRRSIDHKDRYRDDETDAPAEGEVIVCEWQWYDLETAYLTADTVTGGTRTVDKEEAEALREGGVRVVTITRRRYWRAFAAGEQVLQVDELPDGEFTYKCITGKRDRNKGTWFGLMRLMRDPQKWANSFFSQILHIIQTTTKGGVLAEEGAIEDPRAFEESLARVDRVTLVPEGTLQAGRIQQKAQTPYPQGLDRLMEIAVSAIRDTTGVNQEMLGLVEREQPGVLEDQRKRAAHGVLASFFDSVRRYRKAQGGLLLKLMRYLPPGYLVRIVGEDGVAQYVPLALDPQTVKFDVIVDEAPAGPQQKERVWQMVTQYAPQLGPVMEMLGPEEWLTLLEYSPFPAALITKLRQIAEKKQNEPPDPTEQRGKEAALADAEGKARKSNADADKAEAEAEQTRVETATALDFGPFGGPFGLAEGNPFTGGQPA